MVVGRDPASPGHCVLAPVKCNLCRPPKSLRYTHEPTGDVSRIAWVGESDLTADDILVHTGPKRPSEFERCADAIRELLSGRSVESDELLRTLSEMGYSERTVRRAKQVAGVRTGRVGFGNDGVWMVSLKTGSEGGELPD
jgi:hypothetical protein